jgi:hypothetical protein
VPKILFGKLTLFEFKVILHSFLILNNSTEGGYIRKERNTKKGFLVSHNEGISTPKPKDSSRLQIASQIYTSKL